ncbi:MAG TPA: RNA polymerase sigma factor [Gemmatimonadaceae bacterium]
MISAISHPITHWPRSTTTSIDSSADAPSDATLITSAVGGSEEAWRQLFRRHTPRVLGLVTRLSSSMEDAEDVVQETWLRAFPRLGAFRGESSFSTWLCAIAVRAAADSARRNRFIDTHADVETTGSTPALLHENGLDIEAAMRRLPRQARAVLLLHDVEGFTHEQIGELLSIAPGTSKSHLFKARRAMRALLTGYDES